MVAPAQLKLKALVLNVTGIHRRGAATDDERWCGTPYQQVLSLLDKVVDAEGHATAHQDAVETKVQLL